MKENSLTPYEQLQQAEYRKNLAGDYEGFFVPLAHGGLQFGPTYNVSTSHNSPLVIKTFYTETPLTYRPLGTQADLTWVMLAFSQGDLVGHRITALQNQSDTKTRYYHAQGTIAVAQRNTGIASSIELVHFDILQRIANQEWKAIVYYAENGNLNLLEALEIQYEQSPTPQLLEVVRSKKEEQQRWLALYGSQGKLGFKFQGKYYTRTFFVKADYLGILLNQMAEIDIYREWAAEVGFQPPYSTPKEIEEDEQRLQEKRSKEYTEDILPKLQSLLKES